MGRDKGSLTEQQRKGTGTTTIQKRGLHRTNPQNRTHRTEPLSRTAPPLSPPEPRVSSSRAAPATRTQHDGTWYGIPGSVWPGWGWVSPPGCAPSWILVKINPVLAEPRTGSWQMSLLSHCPSSLKGSGGWERCPRTGERPVSLQS